MIPAVVRRSPFGRHGKIVVAFLCGWEIIALPDRSPIPTLSETVDKHPLFGALLLLLLTHHWYIEGGEDLMRSVLEEIQIAPTVDGIGTF